MRIRSLTMILVALFLFAAGCAAQPEEVIVTQLVDHEVVVTSEVTRIVTQVAPVEIRVEVPVEVEVTRVVELPVTTTPEVIAEVVAEATPTPVPTPTTAGGGTAYTVQAGDTLSSIAGRTGVPIADILSANNLPAGTVIYTGQTLLIPGWDGVDRIAPNPTAQPGPQPTTPPSAPSGSPTGPNLLLNPSFEEDWYYAGYSELQIPIHWQVATDEGANTLNPGSGGVFYRPEIRVVPYSDLPAYEHSLFIFEGSKTLKAFKGHGPTSFSLFTDVTLQPGSYRLTIRYFPDIVDAYDDQTKIYSVDPLAGEVRIIHDNGGTGWQGTTAGQRGTLTYDFTLNAAATVRLGASFRNRYAIANNAWFLDHWELHALTP